MNPTLHLKGSKNPVTACASSRCCGAPRNPFSNGTAWESVNFKEHIRWTEPYFIRSGDMGELCFEFWKEGSIPLSVYYKLFDDLVLTFVYT